MISSVSLNCLSLDNVRPIGVERYVRNIVGGIRLKNILLTCYTRQSVFDLSALFDSSFLGAHPGVRHRKFNVNSTLMRIVTEMLVMPFFTRNQDVVLSVNNFGPIWGKRNQSRLVVIHDVWFMSPGYEGGKLARWIFQFLLGVQIKRSTRIITISAFSRREIHQYFGVPLQQIEIVENRLGQLPDVEVPHRLTEPPFFLMIGSARKNKNIERGIAGYCQFLDQNPTSTIGLQIVGKFPSGYLDRISTQYPDKISRITLLGFVADPTLEQLYQTCCGVIFPSLYEGFGIPAIESIFHLKPVLIADGTACAEITGDLAIKVDATNIAAIAKGIELLCRHQIDPESRTFREFQQIHRDCDAESGKLTSLITGIGENSTP